MCWWHTIARLNSVDGTIIKSVDMTKTPSRWTEFGSRNHEATVKRRNVCCTRKVLRDGNLLRLLQSGQFPSSARRILGSVGQPIESGRIAGGPSPWSYFTSLSVSSDNDGLRARYQEWVVSACPSTRPCEHGGHGSCSAYLRPP